MQKKKKKNLAPFGFQGFKPDNLQLVQLRDGCHYLHRITKEVVFIFFCPQEKYRMLSRAFWGLLGREHAVCTLLTHMAEACKKGLLTQTLSNVAAAPAC